MISETLCADSKCTSRNFCHRFIADTNIALAILQHVRVVNSLREKEEVCLYFQPLTAQNIRAFINPGTSNEIGVIHK